MRDADSALFETANPAADPEGLITKFLAFESFRIKREERELDMVGTLQDRLDILLWYLTDYVRDRHYSYTVPLSGRQIAFLNAPAPLAGASPAVTVALLNFVTRRLPSHADLRNPGVVREAVFWWCNDEAPRSRLDERLITDAQAQLMLREELFTGQDFPLNAFMAQFFNQRVELHELSMNSRRDRAVYLGYLLVRSFSQPSIRRFLPSEWVRRLLRLQLGGEPIFERYLGRFALGGDSREHGVLLRQMGEDLLAAAGYDLERGRRPSAGGDTGHSFIPKRPLSDPPESGVALIGPIRKTSGLGQATRLSYDVLRVAETIMPTALDFDLDNPAPVGFASDQTTEPYKRAREINLIHLNAESIPLVFAYEQREILSRSYNIGYFFWELNMIPKCHHLALDLLDEIWVSSEYNREIYSRYTTKPVMNVGMAVEPLPDAPPGDRAALGLDPDATVFLTTFDSYSFIERKNPLGTIDAFRMAFPTGTEKVQLVMKTQNRGNVFDPYQMGLWRRIDRAIEADPRIRLINETYSYRDLLSLKQACDCYVSLHRSEGWGFGMIEAMQLGKPVIATAYAGNVEFCNAETCYLVGYDLIAVRQDEYIFVERGSQWAAPRIDEAAAHMQAIAADPLRAREKGRSSLNFVRQRFSIQAVAATYSDRLSEIRNTSLTEERA